MLKATEYAEQAESYYKEAEQVFDLPHNQLTQSILLQGQLCAQLAQISATLAAAAATVEASP